jgi:hypothetical protein
LGWVVTIARAVKIEVMLIYFVRKRCVFNQAPSETQALTCRLKRFCFKRRTSAGVLICENLLTVILNPASSGEGSAVS